MGFHGSSLWLLRRIGEQIRIAVVDVWGPSPDIALESCGPTAPQFGITYAFYPSAVFVLPAAANCGAARDYIPIVTKKVSSSTEDCKASNPRFIEAAMAGRSRRNGTHRVRGHGDRIAGQTSDFRLWTSSNAT